MYEYNNYYFLVPKKFVSKLERWNYIVAVLQKIATFGMISSEYPNNWPSGFFFPTENVLKILDYVTTLMDLISTNNIWLIGHTLV